MAGSMAYDEEVEDEGHAGRRGGVMHAVAERQLTAVATAWHCCLEFFYVSTRLPPEFRLSPADAVHLLEMEVFSRMAVHDLPADERMAMLKGAADRGWLDWDKVLIETLTGFKRAGCDGILTYGAVDAARLLKSK